MEVAGVVFPKMHGGGGSRLPVANILFAPSRPSTPLNRPPWRLAPLDAFASSGVAAPFRHPHSLSFINLKNDNNFFAVFNSLEVAGVEPASQYAKHKRLQI